MLRQLQRGLEQLYRVDTQVAVDDYLVDAGTRDRAGVARAPREQLLVSETDGELEVGLFVAPEVVADLSARDPVRSIDTHLGEFLLMVEGVSHFIYLVWRARANQSVSALELELQAEVDKYVTCLLLLDGAGSGAEHLRRRLYEDFELAPDLDAAERERYQVANANAHRYTASLERRFVRPRRLAALLEELRRFYRLPLEDKMRFIRAA